MLKTTLLAAALAAFSACSVGNEDIADKTDTETGSVQYLDTDGDGAFDAIDVDGDGIADYMFDLDNCDSCDDVHPVAFCPNPLVDLDGDGSADGLDWDCDGRIDIPLGGGGGGGGGGGYCKTSQSNNGQSRVIECDGNAGTWDCTCSVNGSVVKTCSTTSNSACSQPGNGNCCGF